MISFSLSLRYRQIVMLILLVESSVPAYADLQQEMDSMFGTMCVF